MRRTSIIRFAGLFSLWCMVSALVVWAYLPGLEGPALLDDRSSLSNLVVLENDKTWSRVKDFVFNEHSGGPVGRQFSMASFAIQAIVLDASPRTSKAVNLCLHVLNGALLALLMSRLFCALGMCRNGLFSLVLVALWLSAPLLVSSVLYSVQRMAILGATSMLVSLHLYLLFRQCWIAGRYRISSFLLLVVNVLAGVFTKEHTIVVVGVILFLELLWFSAVPKNKAELQLRRAAQMFAIAAVAAAPVVFLLAWDWLQRGYSAQEFTLVQRSLTQLLVLADYVVQLLAPDVSRMGLMHDDFPLVHSLAGNSQARTAVIGWSCALVVSFVLMKSVAGRRISFCLFWFLIGHAVESTVLPLELYFEHRNYFPAMGLFMMPVVIAAQFCHRYPEAKLAAVCSLFVLFVPSLFKLSSQAVIWGNEPLLKIQHVVGHPKSFRAHADLAVLLASNGALDEALSHSRIAHGLVDTEAAGDLLLRDATLACLATKALPVDSDRLAQVEDSKTPVVRPLSVFSYLNRVRRGQCSYTDALAIAQSLESKYLGDGSASASAGVFLGLAMLENTLERSAIALAYVNLHINQSPGSIQGKLVKLHLLAVLDLQQEFDVLLEELRSLDSQGLLSLSQASTLKTFDRR